MKSVHDFTDLCSQLMTDVDGGKVDIHVAAEKILDWSNKHPFEADVHPMLYKVNDLSFDIAENYRSDEEDKADWDILSGTIKNYVAGNWEPTCWILSLMYGEYLGKQLTHSYSVSIRRQNGENIIDTAVEELRSELGKVTGKINAQQTDERYLQNLAKLVPINVGKFKLASVEVGEYLTEPYYSTA